MMRLFEQLKSSVGEHRATPMPEWLIVLPLLVLGLGVRLYAATYFLLQTHTDVHINALMSMHIAEGRHFPLMLYNSGYIGTFEVYLGALLYKLLPHSLFPSLLGFALVSFAALPFFYWWLREMAGMRAARWGLLLIAVGPPEFFYRNTYIGYPTVLLTGVAACWLTMRCLRQIRERESANGTVFALGLVAGLGWWTNSLVVAYLAPCLVLLLLVIPVQNWVRFGLLGAAGVLIGASPWIYFSLMQPEATQFIADATGGDLKSVVSRFQLALAYIFTLLGWNSALPRVMQLATGLSWLTLVALAVARLYFTDRGRDQRARDWLILMLPAGILLTTLLICMVSSRFGHVPAVRYLLPTYTALVALAAVGVARAGIPGGTFARVASLVAVALILIADVLQVPSIWHPERTGRAVDIAHRVEKLAAFTREHKIPAYYGHFMKAWYSFPSREVIRITSFPSYFDRYRPYREAAILNTRVGVINNYEFVYQFLRMTQGQSRAMQVHPRVHVHWDFERVNQPFAYVPEDRWTVWSEDGEMIPAIQDGNLDTPVSRDIVWSRKPATKIARIRVQLHEPTIVTGLQAWGPSGTWTAISDIELNVDSQPVVPFESFNYGWFWSGPFPFPAGFLAHFEARFDPVRTDEIWITVPFSEDQERPLLTSLRLLTEPEQGDDVGPQTWAEVERSADDLIAWLAEQEPGMIYAPRWISERIRRELPDHRSVVPQDYYEQYMGLDRYPAFPVVGMEALDRSYLVLPHIAVPSSLNALALRGWRAEELKQLEPWVVLRVQPAAGQDSSTRLYWTEYGVFLANPVESPEPLEWEGMKLVDEPVYFRRGVQLEALWANPAVWRAGERVELTYQWRCAARLEPTRWAVFAHFRFEGETQFQDDHVWLADIEPTAIRLQTDDTLFTIKRTVRVPADAPSGSYDIRLGLYDRKSSKRLKPDKHPQVDGRALRIRDRLTIETPDSDGS